MLFRFAFTLDESLKSVMIEKFIIIVINTNVIDGPLKLELAKNLKCSFPLHATEQTFTFRIEDVTLG